MRVLNIHGPGDVRLDPVAAPVCGPDDVVVRVRACGVCGSDLGVVRAGGLGAAGPLAIGHEAAGEVVEVGAHVEGLAVGGRVVVNPMAVERPIGNGGPEGAFTERLRVRGARLGETLHAIPGELPYDVAALTEPLAVGLHGVNRAGVRPGDRVVVLGCGPIGLAVILWLLERGVQDVVAVDLADARLERARALGARAVVNSGREDLRARLVALHGEARVFSRTTAGTDVYVDAAGAPGLFAEVVAMAKARARLVVMAAYHAPAQLNLGHLLGGELTLTAALAYPDGEMEAVLAALPRLRARVEPLISHRFAFDDVLDAFAMAGRPEAAKVMVEFDAAA